MSSSTSGDSSTTRTRAAKPVPREKEDVSKKARQFVERVIRLQIETCYGGEGEASSSSSSSQKEAFLHFVRILQKYLQQKDPATHLKVKAALQECAQRKAQADKDAVAVAVGYETVAASMASTLIRLQQIVRPAHWKRAVDYMKQQSANVNKTNNNNNNSAAFVWSMIESIAMDDMIFFTQRLLEKQNEFRTAAFAKDEEDKEDHHPLYVDIGVHYTKYANLDRIQVNGLLSRNERGKIGILAERFNGDVHGNGIYTGNNPYAYADFGDVGMLVARLKGNVCFRSSDKNKSDAANLKPKQTTCCAETEEPVNNYYNSIVVGSGYSQMVVLEESSQCIPLLHFPRSMVDKKQLHKVSKNNSNEFSSSSSSSTAGSCAILYYQEELQKIVDEFFNQGIIIPRSSPAHQHQQPQPQPVASNSSTSNSMSQQQHRMDTVKNVAYQIVYTIAFMAIVGTIVSMSVSLCLFAVNAMSSLSSSRFIEL